MEITVLKFGLPHCAPCKTLSKILEDMEGITEINVSEDLELGKKYGIQKVPTLVFLKNGEEVYRKNGLITKSTYEEVINNINNN